MKLPEWTAEGNIVVNHCNLPDCLTHGDAVPPTSGRRWYTCDYETRRPCAEDYMVLLIAELLPVLKKIEGKL